jgi:hypothetical protein
MAFARWDKLFFWEWFFSSGLLIDFALAAIFI